MRLNIIKSPNATSYYVIKDYKKNGKRSTKVVEKLGTHADLLQKCGDLDPVAWANAYIEELNRKEKENEFEYVAKYSSAKMLVKDKQRLLKGGCLFIQSLYSQLGLPKICQQIAKDYKITYSLSAASRSRIVFRRSIGFVLFLGFIGAIAFDKEFLAQRIGPGVTSLGIPIAMGLIVFTVAITGFYVWRANREFDRLVDEVLQEARA